MAVVDDDPIFQVIARKMMAVCAPDYQVIAFNNGRDMLQFLKDHHDQQEKIPNLMLLDINMPLMDGWMFLDEYRNLQQSIKDLTRIYLASSSIDSKDLNRAKQEINVVDYITKPLTEEVAKKIAGY
jgi:CheY-like chemotaxis protein